MGKSYLQAGPFTLCCEADGAAVRRVFRAAAVLPAAENELSRAAARELGEYFAGCRRDFSLPLAPAGTAFQLAVWQALRQVPFGESVCYSALAAALGRPGAARAVGGAVGANPLLVLVPCHRVLGKGGALTGFSAGPDLKRYLLSLEGIPFR